MGALFLSHSLSLSLSVSVYWAFVTATSITGAAIDGLFEINALTFMTLAAQVTRAVLLEWASTTCTDLPGHLGISHSPGELVAAGLVS